MRKLYMQMYSFMEGAHYNTVENLRLASQMGCDGVELIGLDLQVPLNELKNQLAEYHLEPISIHVPQTDMVEQLIPVAMALDMKFIGIGMEYLKDENAVHRFAEKLNHLGRKCLEKGLVLTYHNHTQEFLPCEGQRIIDTLMYETDQKWVSFELDAGWCAAAGFDPIELIKQYSGRFKLIHIKESSKVIGPQAAIDFENIKKDEKGMPIFSTEEKEILVKQQRINCAAGEGLVDWKALTKIADAHGCKAYIVEREWSPHETRKECLKADIDYYRTQI